MRIQEPLVACPEVLFVCVHNAGRSQMAATLLAHHAQGSVSVRSAGSTPASEINPAVAEAMAELGLDLSQELPKPLSTEAVETADVVITMGCGDACPVFPGKRYLDWHLDDPAGKPIEQVRTIRDDIDHHVQKLLTSSCPQPDLTSRGKEGVIRVIAISIMVAVWSSGNRPTSVRFRCGRDSGHDAPRGCG